MRVSRRYAVFVLILVLQVLAATASTTSHSAQHPAEVILVRATVQGRPATLLLDTGAERSCLDLRFAEKVGLVFLGDDKVVQLGSVVNAGTIPVAELEIQSSHRRAVDLPVIDLHFLELAIGTHVDGVLGRDVLKSFVIRLDFQAGEATFMKVAGSLSGATVVTLRPEGSLSFVSASIQGVPVRLLLETGADASSLSSPAWARVSSRWKPRYLLDGTRSSGTATSAKLVRIPRLDMDTTLARNIALHIQPEAVAGLFSDPRFDGLVGTDVLRQFIVTLDLAGNRMYLRRPKCQSLEGDRFSTIGIQFVKNSYGTFTVVAVLNPSPAAGGITIGDIILSVNQKATRDMTLDQFSRELHGPTGKRVQLITDSAGQRSDVSLVVHPLLGSPREPLSSCK